MYELIKVSEKCYYIESPAKIGIYKISEDEVCLIDSGNDKDAGKKVLRIITEQGWKLKAIYNTHSHADHIGGNAYLQAQTGCRIYAKGIECDFTNHPILESAFLYGGCPMDELKHKFLLAKESICEPLAEDKMPKGLKMIELPGHSFDRVGFLSDDGVAFLADSLSSVATLEKYRIGFIYDVGAYLESLEKIKGIEAEFFVPSHAEKTEDVSALADYNIATVNEIAEKILDICSYGISFEVLLKRLFDEYSLVMTNEQYVLVGSTVRSYLTYLSKEGRISHEIIGNELLWKKK